MENTQSSSNTKLFIFLTFLFLAGVAVIIFLFNKKNPQTGKVSAGKDKVVRTVKPTNAVTQAINRFKNTKGENNSTIVLDKTSYQVTEPVFATIGVDSLGKDVVGYDLVITYNPAFLEYLRAVSTNPSFSIITRKKTGVVIITGLKKLSAKGASPLSEKGVVKLSFQPKGKSQSSINLVSKLGEDLSQYVTKTSKSYSVGQSSVTVNIN